MSQYFARALRLSQLFASRCGVLVYQRLCGVWSLGACPVARAPPIPRIEDWPALPQQASDLSARPIQRRQPVLVLLQHLDPSHPYCISCLPVPGALVLTIGHVGGCGVSAPLDLFKDQICLCPFPKSINLVDRSPTLQSAILESTSNKSRLRVCRANIDLLSHQQSNIPHSSDPTRGTIAVADQHPGTRRSEAQ